MRKTDVLEARRADAADAVTDARRTAQATVGRIRTTALDFTSQARGRAMDLASRARDFRRMARGEVDRRRNSAAESLESLAAVLRPGAERGDRRKALAIVGGSGVALTVALGAGVALGFALSRQLKRRADRRVRPIEAKIQGSATPSPEAFEPTGTAAEVGAGLGAI
jgi:hypothetical protein